jgi:hypothetical protein
MLKRETRELNTGTARFHTDPRVAPSNPRTTAAAMLALSGTGRRHTATRRGIASPSDVAVVSDSDTHLNS